jgi:hypothetical protein
MPKFILKNDKKSSLEKKLKILIYDFCYEIKIHLHQLNTLKKTIIPKIKIQNNKI